MRTYTNMQTANIDGQEVRWRLQLNNKGEPANFAMVTGNKGDAKNPERWGEVSLGTNTIDRVIGTDKDAMDSTIAVTLAKKLLADENVLAAIGQGQGLEYSSGADVSLVNRQKIIDRLKDIQGNKPNKAPATPAPSTEIRQALKGKAGAGSLLNASITGANRALDFGVVGSDGYASKNTAIDPRKPIHSVRVKPNGELLTAAENAAVENGTYRPEQAPKKPPAQVAQVQPQEIPAADAARAPQPPARPPARHAELKERGEKHHKGKEIARRHAHKAAPKHRITKRQFAKAIQLATRPEKLAQLSPNERAKAKLKAARLAKAHPELARNYARMEEKKAAKKMAKAGGQNVGQPLDLTALHGGEQETRIAMRVNRDETETYGSPAVANFFKRLTRGFSS